MSKKFYYSLLTLVILIAAAFFNQVQNKSPKPAKTASSSATSMVTVTRVVDGDTIVISTGEKVRYIGINTPESVDPRKSVECFGKAASEENKKLVEGKKVRLEKDVSETDKYGRLLRYVYLENDKGEVFVNETLVKEGFAQVDTFPPDVKYESKFIAAQKYARENSLGLWSSC